MLSRSLQVGLVLLGFGALIMSRIIPHPANFTPVLALVLLAGWSFQRSWLSMLVTMSALLLTDLALGFYPGVEWVYGAYVLSLAAAWFLKTGSSLSWLRALGLGLSGNLVFFLVSNFGVWVAGGIYSPDLSGLLNCYIAAIPFAINSLLSTIAFGGILIFYARYLLKAKPALGEIWQAST